MAGGVGGGQTTHTVLTVDLNYLKKSYKDSGTKLLVVTDGNKKAEGTVTSCILGNSGRT